MGLTIQSNNNYIDFFLTTVIAIVLVVIFGAIFFSAFKTILMGSVSLGALYFFFFKVKKVKSGGMNLSRQVFFEWLIIHAIFLGMYFVASNSIQSDFHNIPSRDFAYYARVSYQLVDKGIETYSFNPFYQEQNQVEPYHYFDLWLNGILATINDSNNLLVMYYVVYPLGLSIAWLGICAIISLFCRLTLVNKLLAFAGTTIAGNIFPVTIEFNNVMNTISSWQFLADTPPDYLLSNLWIYPKLFPVYWMVCAVILFLLKKNITFAVFILLNLCFIYTPASPAVLIGIPVFIVLKFINTRVWNKTLQGLVVMYLFTIFFIVGFYWVNQASSIVSNAEQSEQFFKMMKRGTRYLFDASLQTLNVYSYWIILLALLVLFNSKLRSFRKHHFDLVFLIASVIFSGMFAWGYFLSLNNSDQMYTNVGIVFMNVLIVVIAVVKINHLTDKRLKLLFGLLFLTGCYLSFSPNLRYGSNFYPEKLYDDEFLSEVKLVSPDLSSISSFIFSKEDYQYQIHADVEVLGQYLSWFRSDIIPISLSIFNMSVFEDVGSPLPQELANHPFNKFVSQQKISGNYINLEKSQCDFIRSYSINHLIVRKLTDLPSCLEYKKTITDPLSNQILVLLK